MKNASIIILSVLVISSLVFMSQKLINQKQHEPWTEKQLMSPSELADILKNENTPPVFIYNIGPSGSIKNCIEIGPGKEKANIEKLKNEMKTVPKDAKIIIYCGCCPFKDCPNIRPAFTLLNEMQYVNHKLLNLPKNLKVDWIDKGYPMAGN